MRSANRFLLKLSGEALGAGGIDPRALASLTAQIARVQSLDIELAIVVGGGNFIRGAQLQSLDRVIADQMGMLATVLNGMALRQSLESRGISVILQSAVPVAYAQPIDPVSARRALSEGKIVIFAGGTGNPFVTTDTAAAIRASEIGAKILLKATDVPGVYSADPKKNPKAKLYKELTLDEAIEKRLNVMDLTALTLCRENKITIRVFDVFREGNLERAIRGELVGTVVRP
ncbi:MAG: UMP kinase [Candidatus Bipolaricaulota bacterium]|nr:UMP kinase [Candidatus Bipolaricaulota bacterium]MDW8030421.1 UMP kinase [Candidatus Bipolaricaulota bacterium]